MRDENQPTKVAAFYQWLAADNRSAGFFESLVRSLLRVCVITWREYNHNDLSLRAAALTYTVILSLVPLLAMSTALVKGLGGGDHLRELAYGYIESLEETAPSSKPTFTLPEQQSQKSTAPDTTTLTGHLRSATDQLFDYVNKTSFAALGTLGIVGILLSVVLVFSTIETAMNTIWKVEAGRSILRKIADYLTLLFLLPISINVAFAATAFLKSPALAAKMNIVIPAPWVQSLLLKPLPIVFFTITFYMMYIFFPNTDVKNRPALGGALLAATLWFCMQNIYVSLQVGVAKYNAIYGSFATLPLFLVWVWFGWLFILIGAQLAYGFQTVNSYCFVDGRAVPALDLALAFDITTEIHSAFHEKKKLSPGEIIGQLPNYQDKDVQRILDSLESGGLVHRSQSDNRLLPSAEKWDESELVRLILGSASQSSPGAAFSRRTIAAAIAAARTERSDSLALDK
jgi:membrane protein